MGFSEKSSPEVTTGFVPAVRGNRHVPDYYRATRDATTCGMHTVSAGADVSAVLHAFEIGPHPLAEIVAKAVRISIRFREIQRERTLMRAEDHDMTAILQERIRKDSAEIVEHLMTFLELELGDMTPLVEETTTPA